MKLWFMRVKFLKILFQSSRAALLVHQGMPQASIKVYCNTEGQPVYERPVP